MTMHRLMMVMGVTMALSACGSEPEVPKAAAASALTAGLYEVSSEVTSLASTDNSTPATTVKQGEKSSWRACVPADSKPSPELLAEPGDKCEIKNSYIRNGRMSAQMSCTREGVSGQVMPAMMGSFKADSFEGDISTLTYFTGEGDYRLVRKVNAKRVGDCPAGAAPPAAS
jgi:hypothetical protein